MLKNNADQLRKRLLAERKEIPADRQQQQSQQICLALQGWFTQKVSDAASPALSENLIVAAFWPLKDEPDLIPFLTFVHRQGFTTALPVVVKRDAALEFHKWDPTTPMTSGAFGVKEPSSNIVLRPNLILVPTLGYTSRGDRMGYGGGYYDRTLAALYAAGPRPLTIGVGWCEGRLDHAHPEYRPSPHDMPLDAVMTAEGWLGGLRSTPPGLPDVTN